MFPFNCPGVVSPAVFTETVNCAGVAPLAGVTLSQEFPDVTAALTLADAGVELIVSICDPGGVEPMV